MGLTEKLEKVVTGNLSNVLGNERYERFRKTQTYKYMVDTSSLIEFTNLTSAAIELAIGIEKEKILYARAIATGSMILTGRVYSAYRDWAYRVFNISEKEINLKKSVVDVLTTLTFVGPFYAGILYITKVDSKKIPFALLAFLIRHIALSMPKGKYIDWKRRVFGLRPKDFNRIEKK